MGQHAGRVLVVDDDEHVRGFFAEALVTAGYAVSVARDGAVAMHLIRAGATRPDLVLLDLDMPNMTGRELLSSLRTCPDTQHLPVVVVTAFDDAETAVACLDDGANDFVRKPVDSRVLVARVRRHLGAHRESSRWRYQACEDELTGLLSRRALREALQREVARAARSDQSLAVVFIDLEGFKAINDELGHSAGDRALECVADAFRRVLRRCDLAARWGGDEFVIALPGADRRVAEDVIARIRYEASRLLRNNLATVVGLSAGISCLFDDVLPEGDRVAADLIIAADRSMYCNKRARTDPFARVDEQLESAGSRPWS